MFCMKCGTQLPDDAVFCYKCGNKITMPATSEETKSTSLNKKKMTTAPAQDRNSYQIGNKIIRFNNEYTIYIQIMKVLNQEAKKAVNTFSSYYNKWDDASTASDKAYGTFYSLLEEGFLSCKSIALQNGVYDYAPSKINDWTWEKIREPFVSAYSEMASALKSINKGQKQEELAREIRKENRFRVVGGGFGIQGAVKGMAMAGAINLGTGAAHSAFNMVGNLFSSLAASSARSDLYDSSLGALLQGIRESFELLLPEIAKIITGRVRVDKKKELTIFKNIKEGAFGEDADLRGPFADAFQAFPFDEELYIDYIHRFPEEEKKIMDMGKDLGVDLEEIFSDLMHYNGFVFHSILSAEYVRASEKPFFDSIDAIGKLCIAHESLWPRGLSNELNKEDGLKELNSLEIVKGMIARYAAPIELPKEYEEVQEYRKQRLRLFSNIQSQIAKTCRETPLRLKVNIGSSHDFIAFFLRLCKIVNDHFMASYITGWSGKMYIGTDITPAVEREIRSNIWKCKDASDIYMCYHDGKDDKFGKRYIVLTSDGIVNQDNRVSYFDFKIQFDKGILVDDLIVNGETWSINLSGDRLSWLVLVIQNLVPFCKSVQAFVLLKKAGILKQHPNYPEVLREIGLTYYYGDSRISLPKDYSKAKYWLQKAAELGDKNSQEILKNENKYRALNGSVEPADLSQAMADFSFPVSNVSQDSQYSNDKVAQSNVLQNRKITEQDFISIRDNLGESFWEENKSSVSILEGIPEKKKRNVLNSYAKDANILEKDIKIIFDDSVFNNAKDGLTVTDKFIISSEVKKAFPLNAIQCLSFFEIGAYYNIYAEPSHELIGKIIPNKYRKWLLEEINKVIFKYDARYNNIIPNFRKRSSSEAFIQLKNEFLENFWEEHKGDVAVLEYIPDQKIQNALNSYAKNLGINRADVKVLFDNTVFGDAKEGLIMTDRYIVGSDNKKPIHINSIKYLVLENYSSSSMDLFAEPMHKKLIQLNSSESRKMVLQAINTIFFGCLKINALDFYKKSKKTLSPAQEKIEQGFMSLRNSLNQMDLKELDKSTERLYILDTIPEKKANNVINSYAKSLGIKTDDIKILYDSTFFGNAKDGMIMTNKIFIDSESKKSIPLKTIKCLKLVMIDEEKYQVFAEPMHVQVLSSIGIIKPPAMTRFIEKINQYVFGYSEESSPDKPESQETSTTQKYECPICKHLIDYKAPVCDNCGTQIDWGTDSETQTGTSTTQKYECPVCKHLIDYKTPVCDNCGTQLNWGGDSGTQSETSDYDKNNDPVLHEIISLEERQEYDEALQLCQKALIERQELFSEGHPGILNIMEWKAVILMDIKETDKALGVLRTLLDIQKRCNLDTDFTLELIDIAKS